MTGEKESYRGLVIRESLRGGELPPPLADSLVECYPHALGGEREVEILVLTVSEEALPAATFALADALLSKEYYGHFVRPDKVLVVFPGCVVVASRHDHEAVARCVSIGREFGIPYSQMRFADLFEEDHPDGG